MPNSLADVTLALTDILDEVYAQETKTGMWTPNPALVRGFQHSKTGQIPTITTQSLGDYDMSNGFPAANATVTLQSYTLAYDRGASILLDTVDVMQDGDIAQASAVLGEFSRSHLVPEIDAVRISKVATKALATAGHYESGYTPSKSNIYSKLMAGIDAILDSSGEETGTILLNSAYASMLRGSSEFSRCLNVQDSTNKVNSVIGQIDGFDVVTCPSARMHSTITVASSPSTVGFSAGTGDVGVVALITAPNTAQGIVAHQISNIIPAGINQTADGTKINFRCYHDCIIPDNKALGIYALTL